MALFMIGVVVFARQFLDQARRLTLTATGVADRTLKVGEIPWADIEGAYLRNIRGSGFICLQLRHADDYLACFSPIMRRLANNQRRFRLHPALAQPYGSLG